jgi:tRNA pseudouridine13 synthase
MTSSAEPELPRAYGTPPLTATLRSTPEDFRVEEILGYDADGEGEHALLWVEKRDANTDWVARELARFAGVSPVNVGFAGLKDRHAVTRQAFTVQLPGKADPDWSTFPHAEVKVLASTRHKRKLKRGALRGNRFVLVLREVHGDRERAEEVLKGIATRGVPNYFGEQRFGREGGNVAQARAMFAGRRVDRDKRSILLSAARSHIFNHVLAARVERDAWDKPLEGEIWSLAGSRSWFGPEPFDDVLAARLVQGVRSLSHSATWPKASPQRAWIRNAALCACSRRSSAGIGSMTKRSSSASNCLRAPMPLWWRVN